MSVSVSIVSVSDCCCLLSLQHNKAAVQVKEDMKKMVQMPILRPRIVAAKHTKVFGASLFALRDQGLLEDGVPLVVRRMVEHLRKHGEAKMHESTGGVATFGYLFFSFSFCRIHLGLHAEKMVHIHF